MIRTLALTLILMFSAAVSHAQNMNVAYVELNGVVARMPEFASAQQRMNNFRERMGRELAAEEAKLRSDAQGLQDKRSSGVMSPTAVSAEEERMRTEGRRLIEKGQNADEEMAKIEQEEMSKILTRVRAAIEAVAKEAGYAYVLNDMTTEGDVFIIYASEDVRTKHNITNRVMAKLGM